MRTKKRGRTAEMKNNMKKLMKHLSMVTILIMAFCLIPFYGTRAADDYELEICQTLKFTGKNATWNLRSMRNTGDWNYTIVTGNKSDKWTKVTMTSSNRKVVYPEAYLDRDGGKSYVGLVLQPGNSGKATVTLNYWKGGKKYSNKFKIVVRRYENPFATLKVGKVSVKKQFDDDMYRHGVHPEQCYAKVKKGTYKINVKMKSGRKLVSMSYNGKNILKSKKIKQGKKLGKITLVVQNKKTKEKCIYRVYTTDNAYYLDD